MLFSHQRDFALINIVVLTGWLFSNTIIKKYKYKNSTELNQTGTTVYIILMVINIDCIVIKKI